MSLIFWQIPISPITFRMNRFESRNSKMLLAKKIANWIYILFKNLALISKKIFLSNKNTSISSHCTLEFTLCLISSKCFVMDVFEDFSTLLFHKHQAVFKKWEDGLLYPETSTYTTLSNVNFNLKSFSSKCLFYSFLKPSDIFLVPKLGSAKWRFCPAIISSVSCLVSYSFV